ncbi:lipopolysaccharide biosynthesis protein [Aliarcobacter cryaerophilus]|uniref:Lipopolysaccharide biosynthesis protein n=2 Tax=Aliarcobacter cryaerophilus TaxID=28198 RepID=A0A2S9SQM7_9BACT|nr:lipopolysaccharide biosynthesis protein [Aliarcobacter cryaerophilus]
MELDTIKLAKKLFPYRKIVLILKKEGFMHKNFNKYFSLSDNIDLETIKFKSTLSFNIVLKARDIVKKYNIRNVIFFGASELKSLYFSFLGFDINFIVRHGTTKSTPKKDWFHRLIYSRVNYHVCISKHLQKNIEYIIPFCKNTKSILIYPSIEIANFIKRKNEKLTLIHTGRISQGKGQIDAIKACEVLVKNNIDFIFYIVGGYEREFENKFLDFYNNLEYKDKIILVGFTNNVEEYLAKSDIFLFPSYGEGFGNSFVEALGFGLKCISYANTSFFEFKALGFDFQIVENKNIANLKQSILCVANNKVTFDLEKNKKLAKNIFSKEQEIKKYLEIIK